jgi:hypothetical protein
MSFIHIAQQKTDNELTTIARPHSDSYFGSINVKVSLGRQVN